MKILFVCYGLGIGGIEKCLVNLVNAMPEDKYDIDILLMNPEYELKDQIHRKVCYIDTFEYVMNTTDTMPEIKKRGGIGRNIGWFLRYCLFRVANKKQKKAWRFFKPLQKKYDVAIAYSHHDFSKYYVIDRVTAKKKYIFYHDGIYKLDEIHKQRDREYFEFFDKIIAVSKCTAEMLSKVFPNVRDKIIVKYNIINKTEIQRMAREPVEMDLLELQPYIVTVGRLVDQKQPLYAVELCKRLIEQGFDIHWIWVGDGNRKEQVLKQIEDYSLQDRFILAGNQNNPYPFVNHCSVYVQPSHDEAFCTTTNEARMLGKVIVATDCSGMDEQIIDGETGYIVQNDLDQLSDRITHLLNDSKLRGCMEENLLRKKSGMISFKEEYSELF